MKRFVLLFSLLTFAAAASFAQITQTQMVTEWQRAKAYTKEYLEAMPADGYAFKPTPEMRSFAAQMLHLADGNYHFMQGINGKSGPFGKESPEKVVSPVKDLTIKTVMESYDYVIDVIKSMTPEQLQDNVKFGGMEMSKALLFAKAFEHQTHHRGQTTVYLRLKGVTPPAEKLF